MKIRIAFVKQDCWIGVYWKTAFAAPNEIIHRITTVYVCIIPCVPIIFERTELHRL